MRGYPQFSFWISLALAKICFSRIVINRAKYFGISRHRPQIGSGKCTALTVHADRVYSRLYGAMASAEFSGPANVY